MAKYFLGDFMNNIRDNIITSSKNKGIPIIIPDP